MDDSLEAVDLLGYLECDPRPTFVLDTTVAEAVSHKILISLVYCNPALDSSECGRLLGAIKANDSIDFSRWAANVQHDTPQACLNNHFVYHGILWTRALVKSRWSVISGLANEIASGISPETSTTIDPQPITHNNVSQSSFDWTGELPPIKITPHIEFIRSIDWSSTPLGPMTKWSSQLRSTANLVMQDPRPAVIFWGPDLVMVYNEPYVEILGELHPGCMGACARIILRDVWDHFEPIVQRNLAGESVEETNTPISLVRSGFLEETYFSLKFIPVWDNNGVTVGHYETVTETTREQKQQRRLATLLELSEEIPKVRATEGYWTLATEVLSHNDKDIPFALLYSVECDDEPSSDTRLTSPQLTRDQTKCKLRGSLGIDDTSSSQPEYFEFQEDDGFMSYFREAMLSQQPTTVQLDKGTETAGLVSRLQRRGFGDPCRALAICPINPTSTSDDVLGFLVVGLNPRSPYDDDYRQFILMTSRLLAASLTSILWYEENIGQQERAVATAETIKSQLMEQLLTTQKEVERNSLKFQRFAERADIGIFIIGMDGVYSYRNDAWYGIFQPKDREVELGDAWEELIDDEYRPHGQAKFKLLLEEKQHQSFELRLKRLWNAPGWEGDTSANEQQPMWVLCSVFPELSEEDEVLEIVGCVTDISRQKWGEKVQTARALDAQESKRQLESFIDTTSHEMRNPLSAIIQCADGIISSHKKYESLMGRVLIPENVLEAGIDAAETIVQCAQHMKCIVDDVLAMSKLDSGLLVITPVDVQPEKIARHAVKMFEGEAKSADVSLHFGLEPSCREINIDRVSLDPTRLLQILINLITNAIKFTRLEKIRNVSVSMGCSLERPQHSEHAQVHYIRMSDGAEAQSLQSDWEKGEVIYVHFTVQDTGRGLSDSEKNLLFARFSQASPRTHVHYGGSGLGLFISRKLTEMHGGAIGVASHAGAGSTFSFYIKGRRGKTSDSPPGQSLYAQSSFLPVRPASKTTNAVNGSATAKPLHNGDKDETFYNVHVLIVEDNLVNQRVLSKQLQTLGMKVAVANHGEEALAYLRTTEFCTSIDSPGQKLSVILMDWEMPVMDGLSCVRHIRQMQKDGNVHGHVPIIAVTANVREEQVKVANEAGMDDIVSKPFRVPDLCERIRKLLSTSNS